MSVETIQVSTLTLTTYPHSRKHVKRPEAAVTIHNTPNDLIGPPSLNPPIPDARLSGHTHAEGGKERIRASHLTSLSISESFCFIKKEKTKISLSGSVRTPQARDRAPCLSSSEVTTCSLHYKHQQFLK